MENNFIEIVKGKTKDELVRILINKEEYKQELVEEVEKELKVRDKVDAKEPLTNFPVNSPSIPKVETPFGVYLSGVLLFVTGPIWLFVGFLQAGASTITDDSTLSILSMWNILFSILSIVFGIGILKGKKWGFDWGLGTSFVNILWFGYNYADTGWMFFAFLVLLEVIIFIALLKNKGYFTDTIVDQNFTVIAPNNSKKPELSIEERENETYKSLVIKLNSLIKSDKNSFLGANNGSEIIQLLNDLCTTKDTAIHLLKTYHQLYRKDLIDDLKSLSSSYDKIKDFCKVFIDYGIISGRFPHERI